MMKKYFMLSVVLSFAWTSTLFAQVKNKQAVIGEGAVVQQEIELATFSGIQSTISGNIILIPGATQKVVVEGQQNVIDDLKRPVKDGHWKISFGSYIRDAKPLTIYITVPTIDHIGLSGSGSIRTQDGFTSLKSLGVSVSGSGDLSLDGEANRMTARLTGSGKIQLTGSAKDLQLVLSGSGNIDAGDLKVSSCNVQITGSGNAMVHVDGDLNTSITGSGDVQYTGNASVTSKNTGSGKVKKI